jgi:hypothetical protein
LILAGERKEKPMHSRITAALAICALAIFARPMLAADAPDALTPRHAAESFCKAMENGDVAGAKSLAVGSEKQLALLETIVPFVQAFKQLENAAFKKWGEAGRSELIASPGGETRFDVYDRIKTDREEITGDNATLTTTDPKATDRSPMKLKKVAGQWKMDLSSVQDEGMDDPKNVKIFKSMTDVAKATAAEIDQGKYPDAATAKQAMGQKILTAMGVAGVPAEVKK